MAFCPKCGTEYRYGIYECAGCGVTLIEKAPPTPVVQVNEPLIELIRLYNADDARMVAETLRKNGIHCAVFGAEMREMIAGILGTKPLDGATLHDIILKVPESRFHEATEIVGAMMVDEQLIDDDVEILECSECGCPVDPEYTVCPACGEKLTE